MKVTYNWLKDFVDISLPADKLADRLTMAGLEVESREEKAGDTVFTIEVTSNRPDWLSVRGIAREIATLTGKKLNSGDSILNSPGRKIKGIKYAVPGISIEDKKDCPLYMASLIRGVRCAPSPDWMRTRLELVGVRPVNNIVDITNYVLFERGEPLHAFDLDKLVLPIVVRRAKQGEKIVAIDGKEYTLDPGVLVIADSRRCVAIAGVMGGKDTEVTASTKNVLLEAAIFDPVLVRRGRQKLGLQSEASYRFERGIDPASPQNASLAACALMQELAAGTLTAQNTSGAAAEKPRTLSLDAARTADVLGADIPAAVIKGILQSLGFAVTAKGNKKFSIKVPSFRRDVKAREDLEEEVARIYGYDRIPSILPAMVLQPQQAPAAIPAIKEMLRGQGLDEVLTYSLCDRESAQGFCDGASIVEVSNPLSSEQEILRPGVMPSLCRCVAYNLNQRQPQVAIFEVAKIYAGPDRETTVLGIAIAGSFSRWFGPQAGNLHYEAGFLSLKGIINALCARLGIAAPSVRYEYADGFSVSLRVRGNPAGILRKLSDKEREYFDIKEKNVFLAEILLDPLCAMAAGQKIFTPFPRFPSISRDITLEVSAEIPVEKMLEAARARGKGLLSNAAFLDYYDKNLPSGVKRITITCTYAAADRTLTETEIAPVHAAVVENLKSAFDAQIR
jgi:phenylalanyl-tRNA synthetase beta chain